MINLSIILIHLFSTMCMVIPITNFLPYKISNKNRNITFLLFYLTQYISYTIFKIEYTVLIIVPLLILVITLFTKEYKLPNYEMSLVAYLFIVMINNIIVSIFLKFEINVAALTTNESLLFQAAFTVFIVWLSYIIGNRIRKRKYLFENFMIIFNSLSKKLVIILPSTIVFVIYCYLVNNEDMNDYPYEIILSNTIKTSLIFCIILFVYICLAYKIYEMTLRYEKRVDTIADYVSEIGKLSEDEIRDFEEVVDSEGDDLTRKIAREILEKVKSST